MKLLPRSFYLQKTEIVAQELLGKTLCFRSPSKRIFKGRIAETEAYLGIDDPACHSFGERRTERVRSMYLHGGHSYVYRIYGIYDCLNVVTRSPAEPEAVLIRAVEPLGYERAAKITKSELPTNGPGKLCRAWGITKKHDGLALFTRSSGLWIEDGERSEKIVKTTRIGVDYAGRAAAWKLRFYLANNPFISSK
jgi:DNA-3-methyladenine glycosylase